MDYKINLCYLVKYIADFRYLLLEHLSATEVPIVAAVVKFKLNLSDSDGYTHEGHEVEQLRRRISGPLKWWQDGLGDTIPSVWLSVDWMPSSFGVEFDLSTLYPWEKEKSIMNIFKKRKYHLSPIGSDNFAIIEGDGGHMIRLYMSKRNAPLNTKNLVDMGVLTYNGQAEHVMTPTEPVCLSSGGYSMVLPFELVDKLGLLAVVQDLAGVNHNTEQ